MKRHFLYLTRAACACFALAVTISVLPAMAADTHFQVVTLTEDPGPSELAAAKAALSSGQIIMMPGRDTVKFDSLLDVGLGRNPVISEAPHRLWETLRLMATRLDSSGSLHTYECYTPFTYRDTDFRRGRNCTSAFEEWVLREEENASTVAAVPEPLVADWTELGRPDVDYFDREGNQLSDRVRLYRVNDNDFQKDWYLIVRDPLSSPNYKDRCEPPRVTCGYWTNKRDFQTSLDRSLVSNPGFIPYEWSPVNEIKDGGGQLSIGASLAGVVPSPGVGYTLNWSQPSVETKVYTNVGQKEISWVEKFSRADTSTQAFTSHNAMIFQVPEGTLNFNVRLYSYFESKYQGFFSNDYPSRTETRNVTLAAPLFDVNPRTISVVPKGVATLAIDASIPGYSAQGLRWRVAKEPSGFSVSPSSGSGPLFVTVRATTAGVGDVDTIEFDTNPSQAAPSVARQPLQVQVRVVTKPASEGVLLAGGSDWSGQTLSTAEVWDPQTRTTTPTPPMRFPRRQHTATLLNDGKILVTGGFDSSGNPQRSAEIFDPSTGSFTLTGEMTTARSRHTATLLTTGPKAGNVLVTGGCCVPGTGDALKSAELYNPQTGIFTPAQDLQTRTLDQTATRLTDGSVMIAGGTIHTNYYLSSDTVQLYNPNTEVFEVRPERHLQNGRQGHAATLLLNGQVLISGGWRAGDDPSRTAELFTPQASSFSFTGSMTVGRRYQASTLLLNGKVLVLGGFNGTNSAEIFSSDTGVFEGTAGLMLEERDRPTATLIFNTETDADQKALIAGGVLGNTGSTSGRRLELYDPNSSDFNAAGLMTTARYGLTATLFHALP